jgi:hypothetical protein
MIYKASLVKALLAFFLFPGLSIAYTEKNNTDSSDESDTTSTYHDSSDDDATEYEFSDDYDSDDDQPNYPAMAIANQDFDLLAAYMADKSLDTDPAALLFDAVHFTSEAAQKIVRSLTYYIINPPENESEDEYDATALPLPIEEYEYDLSPLHIVAQYKEETFIQALAKEKSGEKPYVYLKEFLEIINPQWVDLPDHNHDTPLHHAARANNLNNVALLLEYDACPKKKNLFSQRPVQCTTSLAVKKLLSKHHCDHTHRTRHKYRERKHEKS